MAVDKAELCHKKINRSHSHKRGEHTKNQGTFHQCLSSLKFEGGDCVCSEDNQKGTKQTAYDGNQKGVSKPTHIVVHNGVSEKKFETVKGIFTWEKAVETVHITAFGETTYNQPKAGKNEDERYNYQYCIG